MGAIPLGQPARVSALIRTEVDERLRPLVGKAQWNEITTWVTMDKVRKLNRERIPYAMQRPLKVIGEFAVSKAAHTAMHAITHSQGVSASVAIAGHTVAGPGTAAAPWLTALSIFCDYSGVVNKNHLHDVCPQIPNQQSPFRCDCIRNEDGVSECDDAITWLINRSEIDLCVTAVSFMLAGLPAIGQTAYRQARKRFQQTRIVREADSVYISPTPKAKWKPNASKCFECDQKINSAFKTGADRHHCRVCGQNFCGECCSIKTELLNPLSKSGRETGVQRDQLICNSCVASAKEDGKRTRRYEDGPHRRATILKRNALPKSAGHGGCPRALAALYAIFNGCTTGMFWALIARDGNDDIVNRLKM